MVFAFYFAVTLLSLMTTVLSHPKSKDGTSRIVKRYSLVEDYTSANFWDGFNFFTGADPTGGFVEYITEFEAYLLGYINTNNNQVYMGVDATTVNPANGRISVRVESKQSYTHGLFIADIAHMPSSTCGVWPSYWMYGPNFPASGEIDIIENVNYVFTNQLTLHTNPGCNINIAGSAAGTTLENSNCNYVNGNDGCSVTTTNTNGYGDQFNANGGGVYATLWESSGITIWFFQRGSIPGDITNGAPNPSGWGTPMVAFNGGSGCNIDSFFANNNIVFDIDFCGNWAGTVWENSPCYQVWGGTCVEFVSKYPLFYENAYWLINSLKRFGVVQATDSSTLHYSSGERFRIQGGEAIVGLEGVGAEILGHFKAGSVGYAG